MRAGSLILAPADGAGSQTARITTQDEIGDVSQVIVNLQTVKQIDALEHLVDLAC